MGVDEVRLFTLDDAAKPAAPGEAKPGVGGKELVGKPVDAEAILILLLHLAMKLARCDHDDSPAMLCSEQAAQIGGIELEPSPLGRKIRGNDEEDRLGCPNLARLSRLPPHVASDPRSD
jgi:hypothetical protein